MIELFDKAIIPIDQIVDWAGPGQAAALEQSPSETMQLLTTQQPGPRPSWKQARNLGEIDVFTEFCAYV